MTSYRIEKDSLGEVKVEKNKLWGAQTQRSLNNFHIGSELMPQRIIRSLIMIKKAAAICNMNLELLEPEIGNAIKEACDEILKGKYIDQFPLVVWQTGSGTQTNMNINEVICSVADHILHGSASTFKTVHPNDHVNLGQSSNDAFPTAMHIATTIALEECLFPALDKLKKQLEIQVDHFSKIVKIGRTHYQDATPLTLGQEFSGYLQQISNNIDRLQTALPRLHQLAQGGTAVGTGINCHPKFTSLFITEINKITGYNFVTAPNKFEALASNDTMVEISGHLNTIAVSLIKIANDIRFLGSGPRCGIGELLLPENEPGSSIMPGKVNPTQCEAMSMVCAQVFGNHYTVTFAGSQGNLELNVYKPVIIYNVLQSIDLLSGAVNSFVDNCLSGIEVNHERIENMVENSLMLVTALSPHIGYDRASKIARHAHHRGISLKKAGEELGYVSKEEFEKFVRAEDMV